MLSRREVFFHSRISFNQTKQFSKHACLVLFSFFCATGAALNGGVHSHQVFAISSSQRVRGIESTQPRGLQHDKKSERVMFCDQEQRAKCLNSQESSCAFRSVACAKSLLKSNKAHTITPSLCLKFIVESISKRAQFDPTTFKAFKFIVASTSITDFQLIALTFKRSIKVQLIFQLIDVFVANKNDSCNLTATHANFTRQLIVASKRRIPHAQSLFSISEGARFTLATLQTFKLIVRFEEEQAHWSKLIVGGSYSKISFSLLRRFQNIS